MSSYARAPWPIAGLAMVMLATTNGMTTTGITVFDEALINEFGWSRTELKFRDLINFWGAALLMPLIGYTIDKMGPRFTTSVGLVLLCATLLTYSTVQSLTMVYILHGVFALALGLAGSIAMVVLVSHIFRKKQGLAIGITLAGTSLGGIVLGLIGPRMLEAFGWRISFRYEAIVPVILLGLLLVMVKKGADRQGRHEDQPDNAPSIALRDALNTPAFWGIGLSGFLTYGSILAIISNLYLYMRDLGFTEVTSGRALSLLLTGALIGKFLSGALSDVFNPYKLFPILMVTMAIGTAGLATMDVFLVWPSLVIIALGWGGMYTLYNYLIIKTFGLMQAGRIGGWVSVLESLGAGAGPIAAAYVYQQTGSYGPAFAGIFVILLISLVIARLVKPVEGQVSLANA